MPRILHRAQTAASFLFRWHVFLWDNSVKHCRCFSSALTLEVASQTPGCFGDGSQARQTSAVLCIAMLYCHLVFEMRPVPEVCELSRCSLLGNDWNKTKRQILFFQISKSSIRRKPRFLHNTINFTCWLHSALNGLFWLHCILPDGQSISISGI